jgi:hypothetical protein
MTERTDRTTDPTDDPLAHPDEPGAYVGRKPERQAETIPGGIRSDDERIAAHSTQVGDTSGVERTPDGHREGRSDDDDLIREAGQDR